MKLSSKIIIGIMLIIIVGMYVSNYQLKKVVAGLDKNEAFWNYKTVLSKPFKHIKINNGIICNTVYKTGTKSEVKLINDNWISRDMKGLEVQVKEDTLYLNFPEKYLQKFDDNSWIQTFPLILVSSPEILSISVRNGQLKMQDMSFKNYCLNLAGKSKLTISSLSNQISNLQIEASDSSFVKLALSKENKTGLPLTIENCSAQIRGASTLSLPDAHVIKYQSFKIDDPASIEMSGYDLNQMMEDLKRK